MYSSKILIVAYLTASIFSMYFDREFIVKNNFSVKDYKYTINSKVKRKKS